MQEVAALFTSLASSPCILEDDGAVSLESEDSNLSSAQKSPLAPLLSLLS